MKFFAVALFSSISITLFSQDSLPNFNVAVLRGEKAQISWTNQFPNCIQLSVQKSYDSLRFFQTIFSSLSPELPQNGYVDNNYLPQIKIYYRIFYVLDDGKYFFTQSKSATKPTTIIVKNISLEAKDKVETDKTSNKYDTSQQIKQFQLITTPNPNALPIKKIITIYRRNLDTLFNVLDESSYKKFKDSIGQKTKDTLFSYENEIVIWKPFIPKPLWKPSLFVYSTLKGYIEINLPKYKTSKYHIVFFDENNNELFKIKQISQPKLKLEKVNFLKSGLYHFNLFDESKLIESNMFYIDKDF